MTYIETNSYPYSFTPFVMIFELHWIVVSVNWKWERKAETTTAPVFLAQFCISEPDWLGCSEVSPFLSLLLSPHVCRSARPETDILKKNVYEGRAHAGTLGAHMDFLCNAPTVNILYSVKQTLEFNLIFNLIYVQVKLYQIKCTSWGLVPEPPPSRKSSNEEKVLKTKPTIWTLTMNQWKKLKTWQQYQITSCTMS